MLPFPFMRQSPCLLTCSFQLRPEEEQFKKVCFNVVILEYPLSLCSRRVKRLDLKLDSGPYHKLDGLPVLGHNSTNSNSYDNN